MALLQITSPHTHGPSSTAHIMKQVILATLPGLIVLSYFFGPGTFINVVLASAFALASEALILKLRKRPLSFYLSDYSAVLTGVLLGLALPPYCPWWIVAVGATTAMLLGKHVYGGLGFNPFNPAMVGYVVLLISFPVEMTQWAAPRQLLAEGQNLIGPLSALQHTWMSLPLDAYTGATPLDMFKQNQGQLVEQWYANHTIFSKAQWAGAGWEWANIAFLLGGLYLLYKKIFTWHAPLSMLVVLSLLSLLFYDGGSSASGGSVALHLLSGGTMLGAFFILTDPVTSAVSNRGRLIFGAGAGALIYVIRVWGNYPDAVAFAILLMNFAAPTIDYYTLPRTYGHAKSRRATEKTE